MPTTLILGLVAIFILVRAMKKKAINEKYMWLIFTYIILGILAVLGYCGMMLGMILQV
jgi:bacteriorhodopsin